MKFIFSFLLIFAFLSPVHATVTENCEINTSNASGCSIGCELDEFADPPVCSQCQSGYYNDGTFDGCHSCTGVTGYNPTTLANAHKQHPNGASSCSDWICMNGYTRIGNSCLQCSTTIPNNSHYVTDCNHWACDAGYYRYTNDDNEDVCGQCPQHSTSASGSTSINQCSCDTGYKKLLDRDNNWIFSADGCIATLPSGNWVPSSNNSNEYKCADHATLSITSSSVTCQCPTYSTVPSNSNDCVCGNDNNNNPTHFTGTTDNYTCAGCPDNSTWNGTECVCNVGYFKSNDGTSCWQCPPTSTNNNTVLHNYNNGGIATNISTCASLCGNNKQLIKTPDNKYYCGVCGIGTPTANNGVVTCNCASAGANNQSLENIQTSGQQCICPNGAGSGNGDYANKCVCNTSPETILKQSSNNIFSCASCSDIVSNSTLVGANNSTSVVYTDGGPKACVCDTGYYKNGNRNECTNCPIGLTTNSTGATTRDACSMPTSVKLCITNTNTARTSTTTTKCMQPIPQSAYMTDVWPNN